MRLSISIALFFLLSSHTNGQHPAPGQPVYKDLSYKQKFSIQYLLKDENSTDMNDANSIRLQKVFCDRNGVVQVCSSAGLLRPSGAELLHPGKLVPDRFYRPLQDMKIKGYAAV